MRKFLSDKRNQLIVLLSVLFLFKLPQESPRFVLWVLGGIFIAASSDFIIKRFLFRQKIIPTSAIISGFIVAGIVDYHCSWHFLFIFSSLAIISKNFIRYKEHHIFNPANFALFIATLFKIPLTWKIESNISLIIAFGIYIAYTFKKVPHILGFLIFFSGLLLTQQVNPLLLISWFFIFIMLIEPKTSGTGLTKGFTFGSIAGITAFLVFKFIPTYDLFISSLFVANASSVALKILKSKRKKNSLSG